jgi:protocatechuate 3,4-dioxygenase beta subunit
MTSSRRFLILGGAALAATAAIVRPAAALTATPRQTEGPFYPRTLPLDSDADLVQVAGRSERAAGDLFHLFGRVVDRDGGALAGARVEIWQCDAVGRYHHPSDSRGPADPNFQGFGATTTAAGGAYRFRTIVPVLYPGRTPHIHMAVVPAHGPRLVTQMYLAGHPQNERDGVFRSLSAEQRANVAVNLEPAANIEAGARKAFFEVVLS